MAHETTDSYEKCNLLVSFCIPEKSGAISDHDVFIAVLTRAS